MKEVLKLGHKTREAILREKKAKEARLASVTKQEEKMGKGCQAKKENGGVVESWGGFRNSEV